VVGIPNPKTKLVNAPARRMRREFCPTAATSSLEKERATPVTVRPPMSNPAAPKIATSCASVLVKSVMILIVDDQVRRVSFLKIDMMRSAAPA
jgi:hypothetical protein